MIESGIKCWAQPSLVHTSPEPRTESSKFQRQQQERRSRYEEQPLCRARPFFSFPPLLSPSPPTCDTATPRPEGFCHYRSTGIGVFASSTPSKDRGLKSPEASCVKERLLCEVWASARPLDSIRRPATVPRATPLNAPVPGKPAKIIQVQGLGVLLPAIASSIANTNFVVFLDQHFFNLTPTFDTNPTLVFSTPRLHSRLDVFWIPPPLFNTSPLAGNLHFAHLPSPPTAHFELL
jgi:hypothetical protein